MTNRLEPEARVSRRQRGSPSRLSLRPKPAAEGKEAPPFHPNPANKSTPNHRMLMSFRSGLNNIDIRRLGVEVLAWLGCEGSTYFPCGPAQLLFWLSLIRGRAVHAELEGFGSSPQLLHQGLPGYLVGEHKSLTACVTSVMGPGGAWHAQTNNIFVRRTWTSLVEDVTPCPTVPPGSTGMVSKASTLRRAGTQQQLS